MCIGAWVRFGVCVCACVRFGVCMRLREVCVCV